MQTQLLEHQGGPSHSAAALKARVEVAEGCAVLVSTEEGFLNLTEILAVALSAGSARVLEQAQVGMSPEPQESVRLGEAVLVRLDPKGVLECSGLKYTPVTTEGSLSGFVQTPAGWEVIPVTTLLGIIEIGIASLITEAVAIKESRGIPDFISDGYQGI